jgi:UDP-3-O-[3-hydroxymyristoyl] N-acetylglucosamine deacetylase
VAAPIRLEGYALHTGVRTGVEIERSAGPITLGRGTIRSPLEALCVARTDCGVAVTSGNGLEVELVEHFLAALGGLGIREGIAAVVDGPEFPLLDGGAREFADALTTLGVPWAPPPLFVARSGVFAFGASTYEFEPGPGVELSVEIDFAHPAIGVQTASWAGDAGDFRDRLAPARPTLPSFALGAGRGFAHWTKKRPGMPFDGQC